MLPASPLPRTPAAARPRAPSNAEPHVLSGEDVLAGVLERVVSAAFAEAERPAGPPLDELVHETIYREHARLAHGGTDPRTTADRAFVARLRHDLARADGEALRGLVTRIVERYGDEIAGHFDPRVYAFATQLLPRALGALLHGGEEPFNFDIEDRVLLEGEIDALRSLVQRGTVLLVPTHTSNMDSPILGWALFRLGLPPFAYAAGLNLFTNPVMGFFMRHLGAYTLDRKKTDPLYKATVKEYATTLLARGQPGLVFPGGTRSRSGALETHLKLGVVGTVPVAYRRALASGAPRPRIFIVPCTISYPLVLEAASLIEDYLRAEGGPHYLDLSDEFDRPRRWIDFSRGLGRLNLQIVVRFGRALDPVGNAVDDDGTSRDARGRPLDPRGYFEVHGELAEDAARDAEYTRGLATRVLAAYRTENVALPTSVLAWATFERLRRVCRQPDLFRLLRAIDPEHAVAVADVRRDVAALLAELRKQAARGAIRLDRKLADADPDAVLTQALATFGTYHATPVLRRAGPMLHVGDPNLLFYYKNRLEGHGLEHALEPS